MRRLSLTSLIDVIFLLLLFFMLSSTFTRFAEVDLSTARGAAQPASERPVFVQLAPDDVRVNGVAVPFAEVTQALTVRGAPVGAVLLAVAPRVTAQRLTDMLVQLRGVPGLDVTVLEGA